MFLFNNNFIKTKEFSEMYDCNGVMWEEFSAEIQKREIEEVYGKIVK